jgi:hypothetical protein
MYLPTTMSLPILLLCFTVRKPGTTFQEYKAYYEQHHSKNIYGFLGDDSPATYSRHYVERPEDGNSSHIPAHGDPAYVSSCLSCRVSPILSPKNACHSN